MTAALRFSTTFLCLWSASGFAQAPGNSARVLFIGNSLTYTHDLPAMVATLARAAGKPMQVESVALPDFGLEEHWQQGDARTAIARGGWTFVVLQQGPSALPESRRILIDYVKRFDKEIKASGAKTALYMVWPSQQRRGDFSGVSQSYRAAASEVGAIVMPVGDAWREAWAKDPKLALYGPDGFHPSPMGTYLAALVIYRQLTGTAPPALPVFGATVDEAAVLQRAAERAVTPRAAEREPLAAPEAARAHAKSLIRFRIAARRSPAARHQPG